MIKQHINLYHDFQPQQKAENYLSWKRFRLINITVAIWFAFLSLFSFWHIHTLNTQKAVLLTQISMLQQEFITVKKQYPRLFFSQDADQLVKQLQKDVDTKGSILRTINRHTSFSRILQGLSQTISANVWLTSISIQNNGYDVSLKGNSLSTESIQQFLSNLSHSTIFNLFAMNINNIENDKEKPENNVTFELTMTDKSS